MAAKITLEVSRRYCLAKYFGQIRMNSRSKNDDEPVDLGWFRPIYKSPFLHVTFFFGGCEHMCHCVQRKNEAMTFEEELYRCFSKGWMSENPVDFPKLFPANPDQCFDGTRCFPAKETRIWPENTRNQVSFETLWNLWKCLREFLLNEPLSGVLDHVGCMKIPWKSIN